MKHQNIDVIENGIKITLNLGRQGEYNVRDIKFAMSDFQQKYGDGTATIVHYPANGSAYTVPSIAGDSKDSAILDNDTLTWTIGRLATRYDGKGIAEITWTTLEGLKKSVIYNTYCKEAIGDYGADRAAQQSYIDQMVELASTIADLSAGFSDAERIAADISDARENAASDIEASKNDAVNAVNVAKQTALTDIEGAKQDAETDINAEILIAETHANNAGQSETNASNSATSASNSADSASQSAASAQTSATNASNSAASASQFADNASSSANSAGQSATSAQTSATNASASEQSARQSAETAQDILDSVQAEGDTQINRVQSEGNTQIGRVQEKGNEILNSLPSDFTQVQNDIAALNGSLEKLFVWDSVQVLDYARNYIDITTQEKKSGGGAAQYVSYVIPVQVGQRVRITGSAMRKTDAEWALLDNTNAVVKTYPQTAAETTNHYSTQDIIIPDGVAMLIVSRYSGVNVPSRVEIQRRASEIEQLAWMSPTELEVGTLDTSTGEKATNSNRVRTSRYISEDIVRIRSTVSTHGIIVFAYDAESNAYAGFVRNGGLSTSGSPEFFVGDFDLRTIPSYTSYRYKIVIYNNVNESKSTVGSTVYLGRMLNTLTNAIEELKEGMQVASFYVSDDETGIPASTDAVLGLYDALANANPSYVTKNTLTYDDFTNYEYVFSTGAYNSATGSRSAYSSTEKPVILITSGIHGNEPSAVMSTYEFFKALCSDNIAVSKLRDNFIFKVIPVACPWGYDNKKRWNVNGVNINRNFDATWAAEGTAYGNAYAGASAASEKETQVIQNWLLANPTASLYIDYHNSGYTNEVSYLSYLNTLADYQKIRNAFRFGLDKIAGHWRKKRDMTSASLIFKYDGHIVLNGNSERYGDEVAHIPSMTLETSNNQNGLGTDSTFTVGVGAEALAALIAGFADYFFSC